MGRGLELGKKEEGEKVSNLRDEAPTESNSKGHKPSSPARTDMPCTAPQSVLCSLPNVWDARLCHSNVPPLSQARANPSFLLHITAFSPLTPGTIMVPLEA